MRNKYKEGSKFKKKCTILKKTCTKLKKKCTKLKKKGTKLKKKGTSLTKLQAQGGQLPPCSPFVAAPECNYLSSNLQSCFYALLKVF